MEETREGSKQGFLEAFEELEDPRTRECMHQFDELLLAALCAITSGADSWISVVNWSELKLEWLKRFLPFANGIASHDTFSRVFNLLDAQQFEACFIRWMQQLCPALGGQVIPIDGKSVRGSHDGAQGAIHLVSAWHSASGLVLGQVKTSAKSNEITAIPQLLDALDVRGSTVTIDAMGCQHAIIDKIVSKGGDYIVAVKNNQPTLAQSMESLFEDVDARIREGMLQQDIAVDKGHGRLETRRCVVANELSAMGKHVQEWTGLRSVVMVQSTRQVINGRGAGDGSTEWRYYISSLALDAARFNANVRTHWSIENSCHWVLDMAFKEDDCRIRMGHGAENFAILRRIALNLIKQEKSSKTSVNIKRQKAGWSTDYLQLLLGLRPL